MLVTPYLSTKKKINILISSRKNLQFGFPSGHIVFLQFLEPVCMAFFFFFFSQLEVQNLISTEHELMQLF